MENTTPTLVSVQAELPPIALRFIEGFLEQASHQVSERLDTGFGLMAAGSKLANRNVENTLTAMQATADSWSKLTETASRSYGQAFSSSFDMWRNITTASGIGWPAPGEQAELPAQADGS